MRKDVGMTGEITLRGRILPVGGVREKVLTAHRMGLKSVILPKWNDRDLVDVPKKVQSDLDITFVDHMDKVLDIALLPDKPVRRKHSSKKDDIPADSAVSHSGDQTSISPGA